MLPSHVSERGSGSADPSVDVFDWVTDANDSGLLTTSQAALLIDQHVLAIFRDYVDGTMCGDVIAGADEELPGVQLLVPFVRSGCVVREDTISQMADRAYVELVALPPRLQRSLSRSGEERYPVAYAAHRGATANEGGMR